MVSRNYNPIDSIIRVEGGAHAKAGNDPAVERPADFGLDAVVVNLLCLFYYCAIPYFVFTARLFRCVRKLEYTCILGP